MSPLLAKDRKKRWKNILVNSLKCKRNREFPILETTESLFSPFFWGAILQALKRKETYRIYFFSLLNNLLIWIFSINSTSERSPANPVSENIRFFLRFGERSSWFFSSPKCPLAYCATFTTFSVLYTFFVLCFYNLHLFPFYLS